MGLTMMRRILPPTALVSAVCLIAGAGCRKQEYRPFASARDTAFCFYMEHAAYTPATTAESFEHFGPGDRTVFRFGHRWESGSEESGDEYTFEIEPGQSRFMLDSSGFASARLRREGETGENSRRKRWWPPERIVGERTSDSTWAVQEWISWDYGEWRRRESYRSKHPDLSGGFPRVCRMRVP